MSDMQKMQDGNAETVNEDAMKSLEGDLMGRMLLVGWKGTRSVLYSSCVNNTLSEQ